MFICSWNQASYQFLVDLTQPMMILYFFVYWIIDFLSFHISISMMFNRYGLNSNSPKIAIDPSNSRSRTSHQPSQVAHIAPLLTSIHHSSSAPRYYSFLRDNSLRSRPIEWHSKFLSRCVASTSKTVRESSPASAVNRNFSTCSSGKWILFFLASKREKSEEEAANKKKCLIAKAARKDEGKAEKSIHTAFFSAGRRREFFLLILLSVCKSAVDSHDSEIK